MSIKLGDLEDRRDSSFLFELLRSPTKQIGRGRFEYVFWFDTCPVALQCFLEGVGVEVIRGTT